MYNQRPCYPMNGYDNMTFRGPAPRDCRRPRFPSHELIRRHELNYNTLPVNSANNEEHWCETCDRSFPDSCLLEKHKQQHQKCNIDGCQFIAHPKIITKHIQMQHSTGLYKKIGKLDNPEDIKKWREERKKNFPTKLNIEKKRAILKEKIERGEKIGLAKDKRFKDSKPEYVKNNKNNSKRDHKYNQKRKINDREHHTINKEQKPPPKKVVRTLPAVEDKSRILPFLGIQDIIMKVNMETETEILKCDDSYEDDEVISNETNKVVTESDSVVCNALSSLICDYGTSEDEDTSKCYNLPHVNKENVYKTTKENQVTEENKNKTAGVTKNNCNTEKKPCEDKPNEDLSQNLLPAVRETVKLGETNDSDDDGPEEISIGKSNPIESCLHDSIKIENPSCAIKKPVKVMNTPNNTIPIRPRPQVPSTLLQKLLHKEVRHERNIVLQCVRYIRRNNYFDK